MHRPHTLIGWRTVESLCLLRRVSTTILTCSAKPNTNSNTCCNVYLIKDSSCANNSLVFRTLERGTISSLFTCMLNLSWAFDQHLPQPTDCCCIATYLLLHWQATQGGKRMAFSCQKHGTSMSYSMHEIG